MDRRLLCLDLDHVAKVQPCRFRRNPEFRFKPVFDLQGDQNSISLELRLTMRPTIVDGHLHICRGCNQILQRGGRHEIRYRYRVEMAMRDKIMKTHRKPMDQLDQINTVLEGNDQGQLPILDDLQEELYRLHHAIHPVVLGDDLQSHASFEAQIPLHDRGDERVMESVVQPNHFSSLPLVIGDKQS
jgi:hypothetical protein